MSNTKNPAEQAATAKLTTAGINPSEVVTATQKVAQVVQTNPALGAHPEIQTGLATWLASATTVGQTSQALQKAHLTLTALVATLGTDMAAWKRATKGMVALVNTASAGSESAILGWGFETATRRVLAPSVTPPGKLRVVYSKSLVMTVRWAGVPDHVGYALQMGDGTPTGWGATINCARASYQPTGLAVGQKVAFRVAVQRKNGLSEWSDAISVIVR